VGTEVPVSVADSHVAEVGRQHWQATLDILTAAVPTQQGLDGESMSKIVQTWSVAVIHPAQSDLA
jgi:hypothetical protein